MSDEEHTFLINQYPNEINFRLDSNKILRLTPVLSLSAVITGGGHSSSTSPVVVVAHGLASSTIVAGSGLKSPAILISVLFKLDIVLI